ncbi:MAG: oligosaccharide flippase family protein [Candidatus Binatus sp.]|uniref:oligosaccharide flippase family protein n=1 Tax=Candidatus Binatus sp. TaxID=2811406 RepID=UPI0027284FCD|nr:oligosaccharide flippase family protein [Candidatus Binatus sp.]MDO8435044.1 oligosaccharide flippase family protein [Candidatus Binatus sp.]
MQHSLRSRLLSGGFWVLTGRLTAAVAALGISAFVARLLTPAQAGAYYLAASVVIFAALVGGLGLPQAAMRIIADALGRDLPGRARTAIANSLILGVSGAVLTAFILALLLRNLDARIFHSTYLASYSVLIAIWGATVTGQTLLAQIFRGFHDIRIASLVEGWLANILTAAALIGIWLAYGHCEFKAVVAVHSIAGVIAVAAGIVLLRPKLVGLIGSGGSSITELVRISGALLLAAIAFGGTPPVLVFILGIFRTQQEVALYSTALFLVMPIGMMLGLVNGVVPPLIAELYARREFAQLDRMLRGSAAVAGLPALLILGVLIVFGRSILAAIYGPYYSNAASVLALLGIGECANVISGSCGATLMMTGNHRLMASITIISGLLSVILGAALARDFGANGIAFAYMVNLILSNVMMVFGAHMSTGIWTHASFSRAFELARSDLDGFAAPRSGLEDIN